MRQKNVASGICGLCSKYVAPQSGWIIIDSLGRRILYHRKCYQDINKKVLDKVSKKIKDK